MAPVANEENLATADLGLDASLQAEVSPVKAMEYMAFGLAFVAFDLPETRIIGEGAAAFANPGDIVGHARNIDALLADPQRRKTLGSDGRRRVHEELAWERQGVEYVESLNGLLRKPPAAAASRAFGRRARALTPSRSGDAGSGFSGAPGQARVREVTHHQ